MQNLPQIKTIIIEDNIQSQEYLTKIINEHFKAISILGYADSVKSATKLINSIEPELIFMDIELKDGYCFDIFDKIHNHDFEVIFVTAFDDYVKKAIAHYAFSYILKPIDEQILINTINRYIDLSERLFTKNKYQLLSSFLAHKDSQFLIKVGHSHISIKINDIVKCEAEGNYTFFYLVNGKKHIASNSLKYYEKLLVDKGFFKAHRSSMVNINCIESIYKKETLILKNKDKINVSSRNKSNLTALINSLS